jgi:DDE superfamily endonuclease
MKPQPDLSTVIAYRPRSSVMLFGRTTCSASACVMSNCSWPSMVSSSLKKRYGAGARKSARASPTACATGGHDLAISGTWTRCIRIQGVQLYLWRAVDQDAVLLDILVQERQDGKAAKRSFRRLLRGLHYVPWVIVTDKPRSYGVATRQLLPEVEHRQSRYLNASPPDSRRIPRDPVHRF